MVIMSDAMIGGHVFPEWRSTEGRGGRGGLRLPGPSRALSQPQAGHRQLT